MKKWFLLITLIFSSTQSSAIDPRWKYRVLLSPHFEMIYREGQKDLAKRYLLAAEQAHDLLFPLFREGPKRTIIVLQDDTDWTNGLADFLPYPHIVIYPVQPTAFDSIDEYGDWPLELMLHEYAHILNIYPAHGFYTPFKWIFGGVVRPNAVLPRWYLEGLAVDLETRYSSHGRLRSTDMQAMARAFWLSDRFKTDDIATINEAEGRRFPFGAKPYLYGAWWWDHVHRTKGDESIYKLNQSFSRRLPFLLNAPMREHAGGSASELLKQSVDRVAALAEKQSESIRRSNPPESTAVLDGDGELGAFAISPSGNRLVYALGLVDKGSSAYVRTREKPEQSFRELKPIRLFKTVGTLRFTWLDDDRFVYDQTDMSEPYHSYRDLFLYDLRNGKNERLTRGLRAQDPAVSPDRRKLAFVQNNAGKTHLNLMDLNTRKIRRLVNGSVDRRISGPEFLSDDKVLFSGRVNGEEKIYVFDLQTKKLSLWNRQLKQAQALRRTPAGLLVTDAGTGVRNVYKVSADQATPVSNTLTLIHDADYDPHSNQIYYSELTGDGKRLKAIPLATTRPPTIEKPAIESAPKSQVRSVETEDKGFYPITYMWPRYWIPWFYPTEGGLIVQGTTSTRDPIGRNQFDLGLSYDSITNKLSYGGGFLNRSFPVSIGAGYSQFVTYLGASGRLIESQDAFLNFGGNLGSRYSHWTLGGLWSDTEGSVTDYRRLGPQAGLSYSNLDSPHRDVWRWHLEAHHQQFLEQEGYLAYGRSYAHVAVVTSMGRHRLGLTTRAALSPDLPMGATVDLGDRTVGGNYLVNLANSSFLLRGYPSGNFVGRKLVNGNLEWVLPARDLERGFGTFPLFLRDFEMALFFDTVAVDGGGYVPARRGYVRSRLGEFYSGTGTEFRLNTTAGYHLPLALTLGLYYGLNEDYGGGFTTFMAIGLGSLSPISLKTP